MLQDYITYTCNFGQVPHLHTNCQNKSKKYMYCMTTAEYKKDHLEKIAYSISQLHSTDCGHSSWHTCTCFKILQKCSHSQINWRRFQTTQWLFRKVICHLSCFTWELGWKKNASHDKDIYFSVVNNI